MRRGLTVAWLLALSGCYASHLADGLDGTDGAARRDAGSAIRPDGTVPPPPPGTDAGELPPPPPGTDGGEPPPPRSWAERCRSLCPHLVECGARVESLEECTRSCIRSERDFVEPVCRELATAALDCLEGLACEDFAGLQPEETYCAPFFARYEMRCPR